MDLFKGRLMKADNGRVLIGQAGSFVHLLALPPAPSALKRPQTASPMPVNYRIRYRFILHHTSRVF